MPRMHEALTPSAIATLGPATLEAVCAAAPSARVALLEDLLRQSPTSNERRELTTLLFRARLAKAKEAERAVAPVRKAAAR